MHAALAIAGGQAPGRGQVLYSMVTQLRPAGVKVRQNPATGHRLAQPLAARAMRIKENYSNHSRMREPQRGPAPVSV